MALEIGREAPDFELMDAQSKEKVKLSDFRGKKNVLLIFYPLAFSTICSMEFCELRDSNADLTGLDDVEVFGISVDTHWSLKVWQDQEEFPGRFLSDFWPHGEVAQSYGVFLDAVGIATRGTFLIDKDGILQWAEITAPLQARDQRSWREALAKVAPPSAVR